jgi:ABC-2 type transport system permease protein
MWAVLKKELKTYFFSPIGYVFVGIFLALFSILFYLTTIYQGQTTFQFMFCYAVIYSTVFLIPLLTMRMFAEERKNGTEQLLITSPRSMIAITLGKFFAAVAVILIAELLTFIYFAILCIFKTPDVPTVLTSMLGFLLLSMAYISFGMFISSLTENQVIAGIVTIATFIATWLAPTISTKLTEISLMEKFYPFATGVFPITETIDLITLTGMFVILTMIVMKRRKLVK